MRQAGHGVSGRCRTPPFLGLSSIAKVGVLLRRADLQAMPIFLAAGRGKVSWLGQSRLEERGAHFTVHLLGLVP